MAKIPHSSNYRTTKGSSANRRSSTYSASSTQFQNRNNHIGNRVKTSQQNSQNKDTGISFLGWVFVIGIIIWIFLKN